MKTSVALLVVALSANAAHAQRDTFELLGEATAHSYAGRHPQAIALYEQVYKLELDHALLPIIAVEYRRAGAQLEAVQHFCSYLLLEPKGEHVPFATAQVIAIRAELGEHVDAARVCAPVPQRVDFAPVPKQSPLSRRKVAALGAAAVGVASLGASLYFGLEARSISGDIAAHDVTQPWPANIRALEERGASYERRQLWFAAAGGAALVTAGVLYFIGRGETLPLAPAVSASGGGVTFTRDF